MSKKLHDFSLRYSVTFMAFTATLLCNAFSSQAQYATGGSGKYVNKIYWLRWQRIAGSTTGLQSVIDSASNDVTSNYTANANTRIVAGTYTWVITENDLRIVGMVSKTQGYMQSNAPSGGFQNMYTAVGRAGIESNASSPTNKFDIAVHLQRYISNTWVDVAYPGIVAAEGEGEINNEYWSATAHYAGGLAGWQLIDYNKGSYTGTGSTYNLVISASGADSSICTNSDNTSPGGRYESALVLARNATALSSVTLHRPTTTVRIVLGVPIMSSEKDYGDALSTYGDGESGLTGGFDNGSNIIANGTTLYPATSIIPTYSASSAAWLGQHVPDAELSAYHSIGADGDDTHDATGATVAAGSASDDEDGVVFGGSIKNAVDNGNNITDVFMNVTGTAPAGKSATVWSWADKNYNNVFDEDELIKNTIPAGTTQTFSVHWQGAFSNSLTYFRFRITTDDWSGEINPANTVAYDGETEDYAFDLNSLSLPVTFTSFSGIWNAGKVDLSWTTSSEKSADYFVLERSWDAGKTWTKIGTVDAVGNSSELEKYIFTDQTPGTSNLYRLSEVDIDGTKSIYSKLVLISSTGSSAGSLSAYPNPVAGSSSVVTLALGKTYNSASTGVLCDAGGRILKSFVVPAGSSTYGLSVGTLSAGIYFVRLQTETGSESVKLMVK